jgi:hypothetical protein
MQIVMSWLGKLRRIGQKAGPYLILEMLLPGGTMLALLLFLYQRKKLDSGRRAQRGVIDLPRSLTGAFCRSTRWT